MFLGGNLITSYSWLNQTNGIDLKKVCADACLITDSDGFFPIGDTFQEWEEWTRVDEKTYTKKFWRRQNDAWEFAESTSLTNAIGTVNASDWEEGTPKKKLLRHIILKEKLGEKFKLLKVRELENLHSKAAVEAYVKKDVPDFPGFASDALWEQKYIGDLIREAFATMSEMPDAKYSNKEKDDGREGALRTKRKQALLEFAWSYYEAQGWVSLPEYLKDLAEELYNFIAEKNGQPTT